MLFRVLADTLGARSRDSLSIPRDMLSVTCLHEDATLNSGKDIGNTHKLRLRYEGR